ncbi:unnamed protein product [Ascophyllum nodosum]
MSTLSFGFPSLRPSHTEEAWFPRLESDEIAVVAGLEEAMMQHVEQIRKHPYPSYVGASAPEEEDDATADEDDDQEEKRRDASDGLPGFRTGGIPGEEDGVGMDHETVEDDEEEEEEEDAERLEGDDEDQEVDEADEEIRRRAESTPIMSEEDTFTVDDDVDMDEGGGGEMVSDEFDFEVDGNVSDSIDI